MTNTEQCGHDPNSIFKGEPGEGKHNLSLIVTIALLGVHQLSNHLQDQ